MAEPTQDEKLTQEQLEQKTQMEIGAATAAAAKSPITSRESDNVAQTVKSLMQLVQINAQKMDAMFGLMKQEREAMIAERETYQTATGAVDVILEQLTQAVDGVERATAALILVVQQMTQA